MTPLAVLLNPESGDRISLADVSTTLGRAQDNTVVLGGAGVSRFHAVVERSAQGHVLRDLQSRNGTFVNGEQIDEVGKHLIDGDLVVFAGSIAYRYLDPQATPAVPRLGSTEGVWIDQTTDDVWVDAKLVNPPLSAHQHQLLVLLIEAGGRPVARQDIIARVWHDVEAAGVSDDAVSALAKRLRARLRETGNGSEHIEVLRGRGFRLAH